ncbi:MAG TPA: type III-A CRISPR-associated RAMP protein Csm4 [Cytophagaceae bacterium]
MQCYGVKMYFTSPVHIGKQGIGMEGSDLIIHSDTLYSVIFQTRVKIYGVEDEFPIKITSAFPFVDDVYYLPKPGIRPPGFDKSEIASEYIKEIKSASFIPLDIFEKWIHGERFNFEALIKSQDVLRKNINVNVRPRIAVDRLSGDTNLYFGGGTFFRKGRAGLYFLVQCDGRQWKVIKEIFNLLQEEGIGGEKSSGYGKFRAEFIEKFDLPSVDDGKYYVSLSLYYPSCPEELNGAPVSYQLIQRSGWSIIEGEHVLQKKVLMFAEGSVFYKKVEGKIVDVSPVRSAHPVYKYGKAFLVKAR